MKSLKKWVVCLDLTKMDEAVMGYVNYFAGIVKPESIQFLHVVESYDIFYDVIEEFPELETEEDLNELLENQIREKLNAKFTHKDIHVSIIFRKGSPTDQIIKVMDKEAPDLLVLGKKTGYKGEGVLARRIVKYVPCSVLFVPETARYNLNNITVPIDFSEHSDEATRFALELVKPNKGNVVAQHLYEYPKQYFPYMPDKKTIQKMEEEVQKNKQAFLRRIQTTEDTNLDTELTLHQDGKMSDNIYDLCISNQTDMIVVFSKTRNNLLSIMKDKLPDRMASYDFGIPLLILKHKAQEQKVFKSLLE